MPRSRVLIFASFLLTSAAQSTLAHAQTEEATTPETPGVSAVQQTPPVSVDSATADAPRDDSSSGSTWPSPAPLVPSTAQAPWPEHATRSHWYGYATLATDGAALGLVLAGGTHQLAPIAGAGFVTYVLGGPIVHAAHDNWGTAAASLGLRLGMPVALALVGSTVDTCGAGSDPDVCGAVGPAFGFLIGMAAAITIDSAVLAREQLPLENDRHAATNLVQLSPLVTMDKQRTLLGVSGRF